MLARLIQRLRYSTKAYEFKEVKRNASSILSSVAAEPNKISNDELLSAYGRANDARDKGYRDMIRLVSAARASGMTDSKIRIILRSNNISKKDVRALMKGEIPKWRPTKAFLRNAIKKAGALYDKKEKEMFESRRDLIFAQ